MKKCLFLALALIFSSLSLFAQDTDDCYKKLESAFRERGAYAIPDDMYRNVIVSFFEDGGSECVQGKARVENGVIKSIWLVYDDNNSELFLDDSNGGVLTAQKKPAAINRGISDEIVTKQGERLRVIFIDKLRPKARGLKKAVLPGDL